jgi:hypothetical protein
MTKQKQDQGVAGLTILLSLIVMLFVIGLLVMIFAIMGGKLQTSTYDTTAGSVTNETVTGLAEAGDNLAKYNLRDVACSVSAVINATTYEPLTVDVDYEMNNCEILGIAESEFLGENVKVTYSYTYEADNTATDVMNETTTSVGEVTDWFDIFIVIGAMVVLILLTVIIITAIRSSGMVAGGESSGNKVGTA